MLACYTDRLSARPGESVALHATSSSGACVLEIARIGAGRLVVYAKTDLAIGDHPTPPHADRDGCGWPAALEI